MEADKVVVGAKSGCLTVVAGPEAYYKEIAESQIQKLEEDKLKFLCGEKSNNNFDSVETFDSWIERLKTVRKFKCQCKCGEVHFLSAETFSKRRWQNCGDGCGLIEKRLQKYKDACPREKHPSYDLKLLNTNFESLEIIECVNDNLEGEPLLYSRRKLGDGICYIYKLYRCKCSLCGKEYQFRSDDFQVHCDAYGKRAKDGYYSDTRCDCHPISSFQWRTIQIFQEHNVQYKVEVSFPELYGIEHKKLLRYDFAVVDSEGNIRCLIECQGEQHYKPVKEFGGKGRFESQKLNDELKRNFAKSKNIPLIEIPFTCNTYDSEVEFLIKHGIIKNI